MCVCVCVYVTLNIELANLVLLKITSCYLTVLYQILTIILHL